MMMMGSSHCSNYLGALLPTWIECLYLGSVDLSVLRVEETRSSYKHGSHAQL